MSNTGKRKQNQDIKAIKKELAMLFSEQEKAKEVSLPSETPKDEPVVQDASVIQDQAVSVAIDTPQDAPEIKPLTRKEKRRQKIRNYLFNPKDIRYRGILSYRYLRVFAWLAIAVSQIVILHNYNEHAYSWLYWGAGSTAFLQEFADMSMPLFLVATFAYILNREKSHANMMVFYFASYFGIAVAEVFVFRRYAISIMTAMGVEAKVMSQVLGALAGQKVQVNVFSDLCVLTAFNFFINYTPKKHFQGKNIRWFRAMCIIPLLFSIASYVVRWLGANDDINLPVDVYPFLTTKSPYVHVIFIIISLWIKYRERLFVNFGATREEYERFLKTNRNSLSFSVQVSILFAVFSLIDLITMVLFVVIGAVQGYDSEVVLAYAKSIGIGQCTGLFFTIPIVLLFSYTKTHKYPSIDTIIPVAGCGLFLFVYVEGVYEIVINMVQNLSAIANSVGA